jgi:hypothetical protein
MVSTSRSCFICSWLSFFGLWGLAAALFGLVYWAYFYPPEIFTFHLVKTLNSEFLAGVLAYLFRKPLSYVPTAMLIGLGLYGYYLIVKGTPFAVSVGGLLVVAGLAKAKWRWDVLPLRWFSQLGGRLLFALPAAFRNALRIRCVVQKDRHSTWLDG